MATGQWLPWLQANGCHGYRPMVAMVTRIVTRPLMMCFLLPVPPQLQQLSLVSADSSELIASDTPALQGKYNSITAILRFV